MKAVVENADDVLVVGLVNAKDWIAVLDRLAVEEQIMQIFDKGKWEGNLKKECGEVRFYWDGGVPEGLRRALGKIGSSRSKSSRKRHTGGGRAGPMRAVETRDKGSG
ncbi:hypothetical protein CFAM422_002848 [Trichoderma lentiforme]|uniref:Uncharacterized protein n=1 Tax=Trichoderma lentiforme TaxID=1567552 RepID=A0A9P4XM00_9HYPO|nr:hypothetical protein CFAM422_002848 [Trichoderma lentiforme]